MLKATLLAGAAAAAVTATTMPRVVQILRVRDRMDIPNSRSSHVAPTPRGGGIACVAGVSAGLLVARSLGVRVPRRVSAGTAALAAVGYLDDRYQLPAVQRLGAQAVVGATVGLACGGRSTPIVGLVLVPAIVNSFNFMDGINGISAGQASVWSGFAAARFEKIDFAGDAAFAISMFGASVGFLPWNAPSASVFLGDVGSYLFGAGIAFATLNCWSRNKFEAASLLVPYAIYLADTGWTIVRRLIRGENLTVAHREHIYQQLVDLPRVEHWHVSVLVSALSSVGTLWAKRAGVIALVPVLAGYLSAPAVAGRFWVQT
ncbi:glycosyltransferase family 4 protein [Dietzia maris]|uniref:glycosyltransferase family 4 protein n=1 Tax=Dietzia maris TaxID=37915 RepID=UPI0037C5435B